MGTAHDTFNPAEMTWPHPDEGKAQPCPFCGYEAVEGVVGEGDDAGGHFIQCSNGMCGVSTPLQFACGDDPRPLLLERWNRRDTYALAIENRRLREALSELTNVDIAVWAGKIDDVALEMRRDLRAKIRAALAP
jgi:hypothetical protein